MCGPIPRYPIVNATTRSSPHCEYDSLPTTRGKGFGAEPIGAGGMVQPAFGSRMPPPSASGTPGATSPRTTAPSAAPAAAAPV